MGPLVAWTLLSRGNNGDTDFADIDIVHRTARLSMTGADGGSTRDGLMQRGSTMPRRHRYVTRRDEKRKGSVSGAEQTRVNGLTTRQLIDVLLGERAHID